VRLIGVVECLLAANRGPNCSLTRAMDGRIRCGIISSCQSAAIFEIVKHVSSAIFIYLFIYLQTTIIMQ